MIGSVETTRRRIRRKMRLLRQRQPPMLRKQQWPWMLPRLMP
jgi:hypothetical protein